MKEKKRLRASRLILALSVFEIQFHPTLGIGRWDWNGKVILRLIFVDTERSVVATW